MQMDLTELPFDCSLLITDKERVFYAYDIDKLFPSASLIKLAVYAFYYENISQHKLAADKTITVTKEDYPGGAGILALVSGKNIWSIKELLTLMIAISDNAATNLLIQAAGMANIQKWLKEKGQANNVKLNRLMMAKHTSDNFISAKGAIWLLTFIFSLGENNDILKNTIQAPFFKQQHRDYLPGALDEHAIPFLQIGNKTGELADVKHDVAIFRYQGKEIWVAALTKHDHRESDVIDWMQQVGKQVLTVLK